MFDVLKWLDDAPIKLVHGKGSPETGGCWMSALSKYSGERWSDHPDCVCPLIASLCIKLNDMLPSDKARGEVIGPHLLEPIGTRTKDCTITGQRRWHLVDAAVRRFAPAALRAANLEAQAETLEALPIVTQATAHSARYAAHSAASAACYAAAASRYAAADAARYAAAAASAGWDACLQFSRLGAEGAAACYAAAAARYAAADAARYASRYAAADAARYAADAAKVELAKTVVMPVIVELCAIGSKVPVERVASRGLALQVPLREARRADRVSGHVTCLQEAASRQTTEATQADRG